MPWQCFLSLLYLRLACFPGVSLAKPANHKYCKGKHCHGFQILSRNALGWSLQMGLVSCDSVATGDTW